MINTAGFYKNQNEILLYGPVQVTGCNYDLLKENHLNYTYPIDGWYWFDTVEQAKEFFELTSSKEQ